MKRALELASGICVKLAVTLVMPFVMFFLVLAGGIVELLSYREHATYYDEDDDSDEPD
jgi:hypothetical protein